MEATGPLTAGRIQAIGSLRNIESLQVDSVDLRRLETNKWINLSKLKKLSLFRCDLRGYRLDWIREGEKLHLDLAGSSLDGSILKSLRGREIQSLKICRGSGRDEELAALRGLKGLQRLDLDVEPVNDGVAELIEKVPGLQEVSLSFTDIGDVGLARLARMPGLERIHVFHTKVTQEGIKQAKKINPGASIWWSDQLKPD